MKMKTYSWVAGEFCVDCLADFVGLEMFFASPHWEVVRMLFGPTGSMLENGCCLQLAWGKEERTD